MTNLHQLTSQSTTSCPTTWRSYRDHRLVWRHYTLSNCVLNVVIVTPGGPYLVRSVRRGPRYKYKILTLQSEEWMKLMTRRGDVVQLLPIWRVMAHHKRAGVHYGNAAASRRHRWGAIHSKSLPAARFESARDRYRAERNARKRRRQGVGRNSLWVGDL